MEVVRMAQIDEVLSMLRDRAGSVLHLASGSRPLARIGGELEKIDEKVFNAEEVESLISELVDPEKMEALQKTDELSFVYEFQDHARYQVKVFVQLNGLSAMFEELPGTIFTSEQLGLSSEVRAAAGIESGLVIVAGPARSGSSTTAAALVNEINESRKCHIINIERPLKFIHQSRNCHITHREVGTHVRSYREALLEATGQDPDVIIIDDFVDAETVDLAIKASGHGCLVIGRVLANGVVEAVENIVELFPESEWRKVLAGLSRRLEMIITQNLFKRVDQKGRIAAWEIMPTCDDVRKALRKGDLHKLYGIIKDGKNIGMKSMDESILELLEQGIIEQNEGLRKCIDDNRLKKIFESKRQNR